MNTTRKMCTEKLSWRLRATLTVLLAALSFSLGAAMAHGATAETKAAKVSIVDFQFTPAEITIAPIDRRCKRQPVWLLK